MPINTNGSNRDPLAQDTDTQDLLNKGVLVTDPRRQRPRWFDGRFLAARDLANEQNYFLVRQADLGRAGGFGVVDGLMVSVSEDMQPQGPRLRIEAGYGITDTGELVLLPEAINVDPSNVPDMRRLDAAFGLQVIPNEPGRTRTGLYVLALREVEWTANPIAAYPTSLTGERTVQDGDIIEAVAVSLVPYPEPGGQDWSRRRAQAARAIFVAGLDRGLFSGTLPLAMVALRGNLIEWVDPYLVRRDAGAERPVGLDFGFGARALREAHLLQYAHHLAEVMNAARGQAFAASAWFETLPPAGRFPAGCVDKDTLTQRFFPPGITVELSLVPDDEIPVLLEESLLLPPLDLTGGAEALEGVGVLVLAALPRADFPGHFEKLVGQSVKLARPYGELKAAAAFSLAHLQRIGLRTPVKEEPPDSLADWRNLLAQAQTGQLLWYVRRRNLPSAANLAAASVEANDPQDVDRGRLADVLAGDSKLEAAWDRVRAVDAPEVNLLLNRFAETRFRSQPALLKGLVTQAAAAAEKGAPDEVLAALAPAADPNLGEGLTKLSKADEALGERFLSEAIAQSGVLPELDKLVREAPRERQPELWARLTEFAKRPSTLARNLAALRKKFKENSP